MASASSLLNDPFFTSSFAGQTINLGSAFGEKSDSVLEYYPNKTLRKCTIKHSDGSEVTEYYPTGTVRSCNIIAKNGNYEILYFPDGTPMAEQRYVDGILCGLSYRYLANGELFSVIDYKPNGTKELMYQKKFE